jgi:hypothetical protein
LNIFVSQIVSLVTERVIDPSFYAPLMGHAASVLNSIFQLGMKLIG